MPFLFSSNLLSALHPVLGGWSWPLANGEHSQATRKTEKSEVGDLFLILSSWRITVGSCVSWPEVTGPVRGLLWLQVWIATLLFGSGVLPPFHIFSSRMPLLFLVVSGHPAQTLVNNFFTTPFLKLPKLCVLFCAATLNDMGPCEALRLSWFI